MFLPAKPAFSFSRRWAPVALMISMTLIFRGFTPAYAQSEDTINGATEGATSGLSTVDFAQTVTCGTQQLPLRGRGLVKYLGVIKVYEAALYLAPEIDDEDLVADQTTRCIELEYATDVRRKDFVKAAWTTLKDQYDEAALDRIRPSVDKLHQVFEDVAGGDRYRLQWSPDGGLILFRNGERAGQFDDAHLAQVYFGIWLGDRPASSKLKAGLIGSE